MSRFVASSGQKNRVNLIWQAETSGCGYSGKRANMASENTCESGKLHKELDSRLRHSGMTVVAIVKKGLTPSIDFDKKFSGGVFFYERAYRILR